MAVFSLSEAPELKRTAEKYGYEIHIHDACGGQAFSLEAKDQPDEKIFEAIETFFNERHMKVNYFGKDHMNFTIRQY